MNLQEIGEFGLIEKIQNLVNSSSEELLIGIGDDAAAFHSSPHQVSLLSTDALIEGVHFNMSYFSFYQLGWRALAVNLSDIAAMGGWPKYAVVTLGLPASLAVNSVMEFFQGLKELAIKYQVKVIGGDTTKSPDRIFISIAVIGQVEKNNLATRAGAQIGDNILVTGSLGGAQAGLTILKANSQELRDKYTCSIEKHLIPNPRIEEAKYLMTNFPIHAMIDISDGLASEINHICKLSQVGAVIYEVQIPVENETRIIAEYLQEDPMKFVMQGGEDFELLFTTPHKISTKIQSTLRKEFDISCVSIGKIGHQSEGVILEHPDGSRSSISKIGYDHFTNDEISASSLK